MRFICRSCLRARKLKRGAARKRVQQFFSLRASKHVHSSASAGRVPTQKESEELFKMLRQTKVFLLLCALALTGAARLPASAQTRVPPINLRERTLANGLTVLS